MWAQTDSQTAEQGVNVSISLGLSEGETPQALHNTQHRCGYRPTAHHTIGRV